MGEGVTFVVDVGNSHTVIGIFRDNKVVDHWRLTTRRQATSDEVMNRIGGLLRFSTVMLHEVDFIGLSSVVPSLDRPWTKALEKLFHKTIQVVNHKNCLNLPISYQHPSQAGADRLCNILAMRDRGYKDGIVVDMGTATTIDVMREGTFAGGIIIPGINASLDALTDHAARLLPVTIEWPEHVVADNTDDALRAGLLYGFVGQLEVLIGKVKAELGCEEIPVVATGGWGKMIAKRTQVIDDYDPYLTLRGVRLVACFGNGSSLQKAAEEEEV